MISNNDQYIIAVSGKKGSGKNTVCDHIVKYYSDVLCYKLQKSKDDVFVCSFADTLKQFCIDILGLSIQQCYGSDDDKNTLTTYKWEHIEEFLRWKFGSHQMYCVKDGNIDYFNKRTVDVTRDVYYTNDYGEGGGTTGYKTGYMTGREVMQLFGTDLIRDNFGNVWAKSTIRRIKNSGKFLCLISDNRFPDEANCVLDESYGHVIRLTRSISDNADEHDSERSLDAFDWNRNNCYVINNKDMTIEEQNIEVESVLISIFGI